MSLTNLGENTKRQATSNDAGLYQFVNVLPGTYSLSATKEGFATVQIGNITLGARQERRVDVTMGLASVQQSVVVQAEVAAINTENANIANTMNYKPPYTLQKPKEKKREF